MASFKIRAFAVGAGLLGLCGPASAQEPLAGTPPRGWNSFDSYGVYLHERAAFDNMKAMAEKLKPFGYEYFVVDNGWFGEYRLQEGTMYPAEKHASDIHIDGYGLLQPSKTYFPNGLKPLIDSCHRLGLKFGVHLMRGIPRKAVERNTPIKGTEFRARDIADTVNVCQWCRYNYGVDMDKPGAQEFYNSLVDQLAAWGVDFIKADDIVPYPREVAALAEAVARCGRPMVLSLSPGDHVPVESMEALKRGNMLRVTPDIWDERGDLDKGFAAWRKWQGRGHAGFWPDLDMIPFGRLQLMSPPSVAGTDVLLAGRGHTRHSLLTSDQMRTFITMRAMAASPLMMGGDLPTLDSLSLRLLTDAEMLACNANGVVGELLSAEGAVEVWGVRERGDGDNGWIAVFNRNKDAGAVFVVSHDELGLKTCPGNYALADVWGGRALRMGQEVEVAPDGVLFVRYRSLD